MHEMSTCAHNEKGSTPIIHCPIFSFMSFAMRQSSMAHKTSYTPFQLRGYLGGWPPLLIQLSKTHSQHMRLSSIAFVLKLSRLLLLSPKRRPSCRHFELAAFITSSWERLLILGVVSVREGDKMSIKESLSLLVYTACTGP